MMLDNLWGHSVAEIGDAFYFSTVCFNGLFRTNKDTGLTEYIGSFDGEDRCYFNIHWHTYCTDNFILFIPRRGHHLHILHIETGEIEKICVCKDIKDFHIFTDVSMDGDDIYLRSAYGELYTVRCNWRNREVCLCDESDMKGKKFCDAEANDAFLACLGKEKGADFYSQITWYQYDENQVYSLNPYGKHILLFDEKTKKLNKIELKIRNEEAFNKVKEEIKKENHNANVIYEAKYEWQLEHFISYVK